MMPNPFRTTRDTYETFIYRNDDVEVPIDCKIEHYRGRNSVDDPSELSIVSCTVAESVEGFEKGQKLELTHLEEAEILERYQTLNQI